MSSSRWRLVTDAVFGACSGVDQQESATSRRERFARLYERVYADVLRFIDRRSEHESADDVAHEVFLIAWRRFDVVPADHDDARAWLFVTARNCLLSDARGRARQRDLAIALAADSVGVANADPGLTIDLVRAWQQLDAKQQEILALAYWEDLPSHLSARVLGISAAAYRVRLHRARRRLKELLRADNALLPATPTPERKNA